jgi:ABC-2 type transport system ATP-binding protein
MNAIEARGLVKQFDGFRAVDGIDLNVPVGSIYGILGPNGAGKTTMLRTLLGIIDPDEGTRTLLGSDRPITQSRLVGYLPEERGLYQSMRAVDTIAFMGALRGMSLKDGREKGRALLEEAGLGYAADRQIRQLSKGMAQTVQLWVLSFTNRA